ncbi:cysteine--tRNA ligase [Hamadaea sp. NPDC051192]|uniref:cysteine--tRNA ligase n=1 Tax=Hamadaea sp. NPDC051192 TaxID=3154940 RepID=UPI003425BDB9
MGRPLRLFNSLGRRTEDFAPAGDTVGIYTCGPTVYAYPHLGNMRAYVFADTLRRALRWKGLPTRQIINITDVGHAVAELELGDDKLEVAAARERKSVEEVAEHYTQAFFADLAALNILPADEYPRATACVDQMIDFAAELERRGFAYTIESGLYFDTSKSVDYGRLALINTEGQREGARVEQVEGRRNKTDFALWRTETPGQMRAMRWKSPWGWGAPGWHLECSVMSIALLGSHFDIHTGGIDHRQLHHVNEIAQSEAYLGDARPWVRYWLHNEFLQFGAQKMAKSAGGTIRVADLSSAGIHPLAYRLFLSGGHYRAQLDYTHEAIESAQSSLRRLMARAEPLRPLPPIQTYAQAVDSAHGDQATIDALNQFDAAISNDLGTPQLLAHLHESLRSDGLSADGRRAVLSSAESLLGIGLDRIASDGLAGTQALLADDLTARVTDLVAEREAARAARDWPRADQLRAQLERLGVQVTDTPQGPTWRAN